MGQEVAVDLVELLGGILGLLTILLTLHVGGELVVGLLTYKLSLDRLLVDGVQQGGCVAEPK